MGNVVIFESTKRVVFSEEELKEVYKKALKDPEEYGFCKEDEFLDFDNFCDMLCCNGQSWEIINDLPLRRNTVEFFTKEESEICWDIVYEDEI